jgi:hypothetical protein
MTNITEAEYDFVVEWEGEPNRDVDLIVNNVLISFNPKAVEYGLFYRAERHPILGEIAILESSTIKFGDDDIFDLLANAAIVEQLAEKAQIPSVMKVPRYSASLGGLIEAMEQTLPAHELLIDSRDDQLKVAEISFKTFQKGIVSAGAMVGANVSKCKALIAALMEANESISKLGGV